MQAILDNLHAILPFFLGSWGLFLVFTLWRPQRFTNSILLMCSLLFTMLFLSGLFGDRQGSALLIAFLLVLLGLLLVPVMLIINGTVMLRKEGRSLSSLLSLILGIIIAIGELAVIVLALRVRTYMPINTVLAFVGGSVFYFSVWILTFVLYILFIQFMPHRRSFDYVIIHGCGLLEGSRVSRLLANRLDKAIELYRQSKRKPILIPSGGKGEDETVSEAEAMTGYLLSHGIPAEAILPENRSVTTMENLRNSIELIRSRPGRHRTALVSSNYHIYRCILYASRMKFRCTGVGAKVAWYYWPSATLREFAAIFSHRPHVVLILLGYGLLVLLPTLFFVVFL